ncbi:tRNA pseudouridine(55) synthase TruB [Conexibacter sp. SYSU D00693]|uniref:tRNA pseudouridine(55) synthase TruB n=1 Tax=Conexibacter sp. SYSU D00693 TaxID=2812560 RepID=UPI00196A6978|nr:tRNA pseudouridine(55) synthase TruB [Conexibacter sp. SYSU D00693]
MDGVLLVDKPAGITSHDVVARVRRTLPKGTRVGHAGTLDPFATGLLLVLAGRATRVQRFLMALPKTYVARARFGWTSTTGDPEGELVETGRVPAEPLVLPTGVLRQRPPAYSAVKVGGRRAYALARSGEEVELAEREVVVHRFERLDQDTFEIACSAGTYVRTLIADLGDAYCTALRRTRIGDFAVEDAIAPPERDDPAAPAALERALVPLDRALAGVLPAVEVDGDTGRRLAHGQLVEAPVPGDGPFVVRDPDGLVAIAEATPRGTVKAVVGFRS